MSEIQNMVAQHKVSYNGTTYQKGDMVPVQEGEIASRLYANGSAIPEAIVKAEAASRKAMDEIRAEADAKIEKAKANAAATTAEVLEPSEAEVEADPPEAENPGRRGPNKLKSNK